MLEPGTKAPDFTGRDQDGNTVSLKDFKGKKLILYFYPEDDTPGCTKEACNLRDNYNHLISKGYAVLGVSADDEKSHQNFRAKFSLPFPLIADTDRTIINAYEAWGEKNNFGEKYMGILRKTYVIDENGMIEDIIKKVDTENHAGQILQEA
jgi:thioredoxin-dependent peroxiredoxin